MSGAVNVVTNLWDGLTGKGYAEAGQASQALAYANAQFIEREGEEQEKRTRYSQRQERGMARASFGASGQVVRGGGTAGLLLAEQARIHKEEIDWLRESTATRAAIARAGGNVAAMQGEAQRWGTIVSRGFQIAGLF